MVHKLRKAIGQRDDRYTLEGMIEMDEGYFTIEASKYGDETQKSGRGSKTKSNVMIMAESTILEDIKTGKLERQCRYFKAKVLEDNKADGTDKTFENSINDEQTTKEILKWIHIAISNAKRNFIGNYHKIKKKYLQLYLNEFVYKLNRRYFGERIFDRLVIANITGYG